MKIKDIIIEGREGSRPDNANYADTGEWAFRDKGGYDRTYNLNRVMMAAAAADGKHPIEVDPESWVGRYNIANPYTPEEQEILQQAFKAVGSEWHDLNKGDYRSQEVKSTNTASPIPKPKRNKYGV